MSEIEQSLELRNEPRMRTTIFGKIRTCADLSQWELWFLVISSITLLMTISLTIVTMCSVTDDVDWTLALLLLIHTLLCAVYIIDGVFRERPYEIVIYVVSVCVVLCYLIFNFLATLEVSVTNSVKIARLVFAGLFVPPNVVIGVYIAVIYTSTGNLIFRTVGAQSLLQSACRTLFLFEALLKFDCHMSIVLLVLAEYDVMLTVEVVLLVFGVPFVIAWLVCGFLAAVYERKCAMYAFWATCYLQPTYVAFQLYMAVDHLVAQTSTTTTSISTTSHTSLLAIATAASSTTWYPTSDTTVVQQSATLPPSSLPLSLVTFVLVALSIAVRLALIFTSVLVYLNFGKGLKERIVNTDLLNIVSIDYLRHASGLDFDSIGKSQTTSTTAISNSRAASLTGLALGGDSSEVFRKKKLRLFDSRIAGYRTFEAAQVSER